MPPPSGQIRGITTSLLPPYTHRVRRTCPAPVLTTMMIQFVELQSLGKIMNIGLNRMTLLSAYEMAFIVLHLRRYPSWQERMSVQVENLISHWRKKYQRWHRMRHPWNAIMKKWTGSEAVVERMPFLSHLVSFLSFFLCFLHQVIHHIWIWSTRVLHLFKPPPVGGKNFCLFEKPLLIQQSITPINLRLPKRKKDTHVYFLLIHILINIFYLFVFYPILFWERHATMTHNIIEERRRRL